MTEVRAAAPDDWETWRAVRLRALADAPEAFGASLSEWAGADERRWRRRLEDVPCNLIAIRDGVPVGQASGTAADEGGRVELISMWVAASARGSGAARALVDGVAEWARRVGAGGVRLAVRRGNERAIRFYLGAGFVPIDEDGDPGDPDDLMMVRSLTAGTPRLTATSPPPVIARGSVRPGPDGAAGYPRSTVIRWS